MNTVARVSSSCSVVATLALGLTSTSFLPGSTRTKRETGILGDLQARLGRAVLAHHRHLKLDLHLVVAVALEDRGETPVLLEHRGRRAVDPDVVQGDAARHQRQGDAFALEDLHLVARGPDQGVVPQLPVVAGAAHGEGMAARRPPGHQDRRGGRDRGGEAGGLLRFDSLQVGRWHHGQIDPGAGIGEREGGRRGARHRQGQHEAGLRAQGVAPVAQAQGGDAGPVGAPVQAVRSLHQLHRSAVHRGLPERHPGRQDRDQSPLVLEGLDQDGDVDRGGGALVVVADLDHDAGLADGVSGGRAAGLLVQLVHHRGIDRERHPDLARRIESDLFRHGGGRQQQG
jgi:hypothetical protein